MAGFIENYGYTLPSPETHSHIVITSFGDISTQIASSPDPVHYTG